MIQAIFDLTVISNKSIQIKILLNFTKIQIIIKYAIKSI